MWFCILTINIRIKGERTKLLAQLRERAIDLGENGGRFLGMNPQQVSQVVEFASNLRRGVIELPLNDRSRELLAEVSHLKSEKEVQRLAITGLEREISTREPPSGGESNVLKQVLDNITLENQKLRDEIATWKTGGSIDPTSSVLTPSMRLRATEVLGEELVAMPAAAEVQFICVINAYDKIAQDLTLAKRQITEQSADIVVSNADGRSQLPVHNGMVVQTGNGMGQMVTIDEVVTLKVRCKSLEDELTNERKEKAKNISDALEQTKQKLSVYVNDVKNLQLAFLSVQESRIDSAKARKQISCLNDVIQEKSRLYDALAARIIQEGGQKSAAGKKMNPSLSRVRGHRELKSDRGNREHKSDQSTSTNSIDRSISRAVSSSGRCSPTLKQNMQKHLEDSLTLIKEKEHAIREQAQKIVELTQKLLQVNESYQTLLKEAERMKSDSERMHVITLFLFSIIESCIDSHSSSINACFSSE